MAVGEKKQTKRISSFKIKKFDKLSGIFISKIRQGPNLKNKSISLLQVLKSLLKMKNKNKELRYLIKSGHFYVNKKKCLNYGFPISLLDNISIPKTKTNYRLFLTKQGQLKLFKTPFIEQNIKLAKIIAINPFNRKERFLYTHDNHILNYAYKDIKKDDSILYDLNTKKIIQIISCALGSLVIILHGTHKGQIGKITKIAYNFNFKKLLQLTKLNGQIITKNSEDVMIIGESMIPYISLNERACNITY